MKYTFILLLFCFFFAAFTNAQTLYWVGGSGNWNDPNHWSLESGGKGGTLIPNKDIDVVFDENSSDKNLIITLNNDAFCNYIFTETEKDINFTNIELITFYKIFEFKYSNLSYLFDQDKIINTLNKAVDPSITYSTSFTEPLCNSGCDGTASVYNVSGGAGGPYTYQWFPASTTCGNIIGRFTCCISNIKVGTYTVRVYDNIGNYFQKNVQVTEPGPLVPTPLETNPTCFGVCDGEIDIIVTGGISPFTYQWDDPDNQTVIPATGLCAGNYNITITDFNNCIAYYTQTLTEPTDLILNVTSNNESCFGNCDGDASASVSGGTTPYSYQWDDVGLSTSTSLSNLCPGTYCLTVTDAQSCPKNQCVTITGPVSNLSIDNITTTDVTPCFGDANGSITVTVSGGTTPYQYDFGQGAGFQGSNTLGSLSGGSYTVTIKDAKDCQIVSVPITVNEPLIQSISIISQTNPLCNGVCDGTATAEMSGGTTPYSYQWDSGTGNQPTATASNLCAGIYSVTGTDAGGCTATTSVTITEPSLVTVVLNSTNPTCNSSCNGTANAIVSGGTTPYSYLWCNGSVINNVFARCAGVCGLTITDGNGCVKDTFVTFIDPPVFGITMSQSNVSCNSLCDGTATATPTGGISPYVYGWSCGGQSTQTAINLCPGICNVTVIDQGGAGCQSTASVTITQPNALTLTINSTNPLCNGDCNGTATAVVGGGTSPYSYVWNDPGGQTTATATGLCAGVYSVTVTDDNGCTKVSSVTLTDPSLLTLNITSVDPLCNGNCNGSATANAGGGTTPYTYLWDDIGAQTTATATNLCADVYSVTLTDGNGCVEIGSVTLTDPPLLTLNFTSTDPLCNGACNGSATIFVGGGTTPYTYLWDDIGAQTTATATNLCAGVYSVTVTDANGCSQIGSVTLTDPTLLTLNVSSTPPSCSGICDATATAVVGGGTTPYTYNWNDPSSQTAATAINLCAGVYIVTATDANGCTQTVSVTITDPVGMTLDMAVTNETCSGNCDGAINLTVSGGTTPYSFIWNGTQTTEDISLLCSGNYCVTVTDAGGCTASNCANVNSNSFLMPPTFDVADETCGGGGCDGHIHITVSGGNPPITYLWNDGSTLEDRDNLCPGNYCVTITDGLGLCSFDTCIIINAAPVLTINLMSTPVSCFGGNDGTATATPTSGTSPYTYTWSCSVQTTQTITNLVAGNCTVTVQDANSCTITDVVNIGTPSDISLTFSQTDPTCNGLCNGTATVSASGGTSPYNYSWNPTGQTTSTAIGLCAGVHNVTVTDANFCTITDAVTINDPGGITVNFTNVQQILCSSLPTVVAGQTYLPDGTGVSYTTTITHTDFAPGQTITSANDISSICANMEHSYLGDLIIELSCPNNLHKVILKQGPFGQGGGCYLGEPIDDSENPNGDLEVPGLGYDYCWTMTPTFGTMVSESNNYTHTYTDVEGYTYYDVKYLPSGSYTPYQNFSNLVGCEINGDWTIKVTDQAGIDNGFIFSWQLNFDPSTFPNGYCTGEITAEGSGGSSPYMYQWSNGSTTQTISNLCAGTYCVTITGTDGCSSSGCVTISEPPAPLTATVLTQNNVSCKGTCDANISLNVTGGTSPYTFNWDDSSNQTTNPASNLCAGIYNCTVYDANLCEEYITVTITEPASLPTASISAQTNASCGGVCNGSATASCAGGTSPYSYLWSAGSQTTATATNLCAGVHSCTVTDSKGCTDVTSVTITNIGGPVASISAQTNVSCNGGNNGSATVTAIGGQSPYTFTWAAPGFTGQGTATYSSLIADIYTVTVTDVNLCTSILSVTITEPTALIASLNTQSNVSCKGGNNGTALLTVSGGTSPYTYLWDDLETTNPAVTLNAAVHICTVTDSKGCTKTVSVTITEPATALTASTTQTNVLCNGASTGSATVTPAGGTPPYNYDWFPNGPPYTGDGTPTYSNLPAGTYSVTSTDNNSCPVINSVTITEPSAITITGTTIDATCGLCNGGIDITVSGGTTPYSFNWSNTETTEDLSNLCAGSYTVTVNDGAGCTKTSTFIINNVGGPTVTIASFGNASCFGVCDGWANITVTGGASPYTYLWSTSATTMNVIDLCAGVHTVTVTDANLCSGIASVTITEPSQINITFNQTNVTCKDSCNGSATAIISGGTSPYLYDWSTGATTNSINGLCAGVYTVTVDDSNGCSNSASVTITEPNAITTNIVSQTDVLCNGTATGSATISIVGGTSPFGINWTCSGETGLTATALPAGTCNINITDVNACPATASVTISEPSAINITYTKSDANCGACDGLIDITVTGGLSPYTFNWSNTSTLEDLLTLCPGNYTVTVTDANGCTATQTINISNIGGPTVDLSDFGNCSCFGVCDGWVNSVVSGGVSPYTIQWSSGDTSLYLIDLCPGIYSLTVTGANGCIGVNSVTISEPTQINITFNQTNVSCNGVCDGSATAIVSGGTGPYTYNWSTGSSANPIINLCAGVYTVTVTDSNGCSSVGSVTITEPNIIFGSIVSQTNVSCNGICDGKATINIVGGTSPYSIIWDNTETGVSAVALCAGVHIAAITDTKGCTGNISVTITEPLDITVTYTKTDANCGACDGTINLTVTGGTSPYTFNWSNSTTTQNISALCAGSYTVTVTDANGCTDIQTIDINNIGGPTITVDNTGNGNCFNSCDGFINITVTGGVSPYTYAWSGPSFNSTSEDISGLCGGAYTVTVTGANNCSTVSTVTITPTSDLNITFNQTNVACNGNCDGSATAVVIGGTSPYTYLWWDGTTTNAVNNLCAGVYNLTVSDVNGCSKPAAVTITQAGTITVNIISQTEPLCNGDANGKATITVSGGTSPYNMLWCTGETGLSANFLPAGDCIVTITDDGGCTTTKTITTTEPTPFTVNVAVTNATCGNSDGAINLTVSGATSPYSFIWSGSQNTEDLSNIPAGNYTVTITDFNGCDTILTIPVLNQNGPVITLDSQTNVSCFGLCDGAISISVSGGVTPYTYSWSNSQPTEDLIMLCAETYSLTVTGADGCQAFASYTITEPTQLTATMFKTDVLCKGNCTGEIDVTLTGGTSPYNIVWSIPQFTTTISNLCAGTYCATITDANSCSLTICETITEPAEILSATTTQNDVTCFGMSNGSATATASGGTSPYTYSWDGGTTPNSSTTSGLAAGTYCCTITDAQACSTVVCVTITQPVDGVTALISSQINVSCNGVCNGKATVTASGGTTPYTYLWNGGGSPDQPTDTSLCAQSYRVTVTYQNGCEGYASVTITEPAILSADAVTTDITCNGGNDGSVDVTTTGGTTPYTYNWDLPSTSEDLSNLSAGEYCGTVTDANGCTFSGCVTITEPAAINISITSQTNVKCNLDCNGTATVNITGGTSPYIVNWPSSETGLSADSLCAGTSDITVTDNLGCSSSIPITITQPNAIVITPTITDATCMVANGSASVSVTGGTSPYTYQWTNPPGDIDNGISNVASGAYTVTVNDVNNCEAELTININDSNGPTTSISSFTSPKCNGDFNGSATISASGGAGGYSYVWSPDMSPYTGQGTPTYSNLNAGVYSVVVSDTNNCHGGSSITITEPAILTLDFTTINVTCNGQSNGSATAIVSGGTPPYSYLWDAGAQTSATATNLSAGTYNVTVKDNNDCSVTGSVTITEPLALILSIASQTNVDCNGNCNGSATSSISGGTSPYNYLWDAGTGNQTTATATGLCSGIYTLVVNDNNGCSANTSVTITQPSPIIISSNVTNSHCAQSDGAATAIVTGGVTPFSFIWSSSDLVDNISNKFAGAYIVSVTDANSCTAELTIPITDIDGPSVLISSLTNPSCSGQCDGSATVSATGGTLPYNYSWSNGNTTATATLLCDGVYSVTVTDAVGCKGVTTVTITAPVSLNITFATVNAIKFGACNGSTTAIVSGGTTPFSFQWDATALNQTTATISNLCANTYCVTVNDVNGCSTNNCVTISSPPQLIGSIASQTDVACNGANSGTATATASGGVPPYTYEWDNNAGNQTTPTATNLLAGTYSVSIIDMVSDTFVVSVTLTEPTAIIVTASINNATCGNNDGSITTSATGGVSPYTYAWSTSDLGSDLINIPSGGYTETVTDANACTAINTYAVSDQDGPVASISGFTNPSCYNSSDGTATAQGVGVNLPFTYKWSDGQIDQTAINLEDGIYICTVTDAIGCKGIATVTITEPTQIHVTFSRQNVSCNGLCNGFARAIVTGGTPIYTYQWSNGWTTFNNTNLCSGNYIITVTDSHSCTATASVSISEPALLTASISSQNNPDCFGFCSGNATVVAAGGTIPFTYLWNTTPAQNSSTAVNLCASEYSVTVTDNKLCTSISNVTITTPSQIDISESIVNSTCNNSDGEICLTVTGGIPSYSYIWNNSSTNICLSNIPSNTYLVTVTDQNNCTSNKTIIVSDINGPTASIIDQNSPKCFNTCDGDATVEGSGGVSPYTYLWDVNANRQDTLFADSLCNGTYSVTVFDANLCKGITFVTITAPDSIIVTETHTNVSCFGLSDGSIDITVTGGITPYTYLWSEGSTNEDLANLSTGIYCITVTDANGCSAEKCITITEPIGSLTITLASTNITCFGSNNGEIDLTVSGGTTPYSYLWSNSSTSEDLTNLSSGEYCVTVTDANGCISTDCTTITEPTDIVVDLTITESHCTQSDGCVVANVSGGTSPYTYNWNPNPVSSVNETLCSIIAGTYFLTVTDANNCQKNTFAVVSDTGGVILFSNIVNVSCNSECTGSATATLFGGSALTDSYEWSNGDTGENADSLCAGVIIVTVTTDAGCLFINDTTIIEPLPLGINFNISNVSCFNGSNGNIDLIVSGGTSPFTYNWNPPANTEDLSNLIAGTYSVTVTDSNGCKIEDATTITQPSTELTSSITGTDVLCNGDNSGTGQVVVSGGTSPYTYLWSSNENTADADLLVAGWNKVSITDASGCQIIDSILLNEPTALALSLSNVLNSHCTLSDGSATINATGGTPGYAYLWNDGQTDSIHNTLPGGIYMPTVTDANGCQDSIQVNISDQDAGSIAFINVVNNACYGDSTGKATAIVTGGTSPYSYNWMPDGYPVDGTDTYSDLPAGVYTVQTTDASTCVLVSSVTITQPAALQLTLDVTNISCYGYNDGSIDLSVAGGLAPYTYSWSNGKTTQDIAGLSAGIYNVTVTDSNGCSYDTSATITQPDSISNSIDYITNNLCFGNCNGEASIIVSGGLSPYTMNWSNNQSGLIASNLCSGTYLYSITDANSCLKIDSVTISEPAKLEGTFTTVDAYCGSCNGSATATMSGGVSPYIYSWGSNTISNLCVNFYSLTVTDANSCTYTAFIEINDTSNVAVNIVSQTNITCNGICDATATVIATGGTSPYSYLWNDPAAQTTPAAINLCDSTYIVIAIDSLNCSDAEMVIIPDVQAIEANLSVTNISCYGQIDGSITTTPTGGNPPYSIKWDTGSTDTTIFGLAVSTHYLTITDANLCFIIDSATVIEPGILTASISNYTDLNCFGICTGTATAHANGGTSPFTYLWSDTQTDSTAVNLCALNYFVTITDSRGCSSDTSVLLNQPTQLTAQFTDSVQVSCNGGNEGSATITPSGGTSPYSYLWSDNLGQTDSTAVGLTADNYTVTTTDFKGCFITNTIEVHDTSNMNPHLDVTQISCYGMCDGSMIVVPSGGTPPYTYIWSPDGETTIGISGKCANNYEVTVYDANFCSRIRTDSIMEPFEITAAAAQTSLITCHDSCDAKITITANGGTPPFTYNWSNNQTDSIAIGLCNGKYIATVTDSRNCSFILPDSIQITAPALLTYNYTVSPATCEQGTKDGAINMSISGGVIPYSFIWSNDSTTQSINSITSGYYNISVTDSLGCKFKIDSIYVSPQIIVTANAGVDTSVCFGSSVMLSGNGGINYLWQPGETLNDSLISNPIASPIFTTEYILTVFQSICSATDTVLVTVLPLPDIDAGLDQEMYFYETITLNATSSDNDITSYVWKPNINITDTAIYNPVVNPEVTTTYIVYAMNTDGCINSDSVLVSVIPYITFPTGFSPNNDGKNDVWEIGFLHYYPEIEVWIFNRWGEKLFYSQGYQTPWDGTYKGKPLPVGTYYYMIKLNIEGEKKPITGPITIVR